MARLSSEVQNNPLLNPTQAKIIMYFITNGESSLNKCSKEINKSLQGIYDSSKLLIEKGLLENPKRKKRIYRINEKKIYNLLFSPISEMLNLELNEKFFAELFSVVKSICNTELTKVKNNYPLQYTNLEEIIDDLMIFLTCLNPENVKEEYRDHIKTYTLIKPEILTILENKFRKEE